MQQNIKFEDHIYKGLSIQVGWKDAQMCKGKLGGQRSFKSRIKWLVAGNKDPLDGRNGLSCSTNRTERSNKKINFGFKELLNKESIVAEKDCCEG